MPGCAVQIMRLPEADCDIPLPTYETGGAAGMDLRANLKLDSRTEGVMIDPGALSLIPTGLSFAVPAGFEAQIRPRSGLALNHGITVLNSPGTVDSDYRGEIRVILINHGENPFIVHHGDRIAQIVFAAVTQAGLTVVDVLETTARGSRGFGSTGRT